MTQAQKDELLNKLRATLTEFETGIVEQNLMIAAVEAAPISEAPAEQPPAAPEAPAA